MGSLGKLGVLHCCLWTHLWAADTFGAQRQCSIFEPGLTCFLGCCVLHMDLHFLHSKFPMKMLVWFLLRWIMSALHKHGFVFYICWGIVITAIHCSCSWINSICLHEMQNISLEIAKIKHLNRIKWETCASVHEAAQGRLWVVFRFEFWLFQNVNWFS